VTQIEGWYYEECLVSPINWKFLKALLKKFPCCNSRSTTLSVSTTGLLLRRFFQCWPPPTWQPPPPFIRSLSEKKNKKSPRRGFVFQRLIGIIVEEGVRCVMTKPAAPAAPLSSNYLFTSKKQTALLTFPAHDSNWTGRWGVEIEGAGVRHK
jgi:hypothetical protein